MECDSELTAVWLMYLFSLWACHFNIWHWDAELTVLTQARVQNKHCHPVSAHTPHMRFYEMTKYNRNWSRFSLSLCSATSQKNINKVHWMPFILIITTISAYLKITVTYWINAHVPSIDLQQLWFLAPSWPTCFQVVTASPCPSSRDVSSFFRAERRRAGSRCEFRQEGCQAEAVRRCFLMSSSHQQGCQSRRFFSTLRN